MTALRILIAFVAGYAFVRASARWRATVGVLGLRKAMAGLGLMWRLRTARPFGITEDTLYRWPIPPTVPILFELQVFICVVLVVFVAGGYRVTALAALVDVAMIPAAVWAIVHAIESVTPPCLLYLGVSEPGQYKDFRYLASSRAWLAVSALDQGNTDVRGGDEVGETTALSLFLPDRIKGVPLGVVVQRRRLESVRTSDDLWEGAIRHLIAYVPLIIADLRSHSTIIGNEFCWALRAGASDRLLALTRDDGSTILTPLLKASGLAVSDVAEAATSESLNHAVFARLDSDVRPIPRERPTREEASAASEMLAAQIAKETSRKECWSRALADLREPSRTLDRELWAWATGLAGSDEAPPATESISAAMDVIRRRIDKFSISLHIGSDDTAWVDLGLQPIPQSFRVCVSGMTRPFFNAATALLLALMHAELGNAWGRGQRPRRDLRRLPESRPNLAAAEAETKLLELIQAGGDARDGRLERELFAWFALSCESLSRADDRAIFDELEAAIVAVQRRGPHSLAVDVGIDRTAVAEIADPAGGRWLLTVSYAVGRPVWRRPAVALLAAAFKAELGAYDGYKRA